MKILLADDHALYREGLILHLNKLVPQAQILQAADYDEAAAQVKQNPDIEFVIADLGMRSHNWEDGLPALRKILPDAKTIVISASEDNNDIKKALSLGIKGYLSKRSDTKVLTAALKLIFDGGTYFPPSIVEANNLSSEAKEHHRDKLLTPRQTEVLNYVAQGLSNKQIAYKMNVSEATVKLHINALLRALGATNRTQAVILAQKRGLV